MIVAMGRMEEEWARKNAESGNAWCAGSGTARSEESEKLAVDQGFS
jgi:hypothetical protein